VIAVACRHLRGSLKTIEEGTYWQAYNLSSYWYMNEVLAPTILRALTILLEDHGFTSVPVHNPFQPGVGRPVKPGAPRPDGMVSLRVMGCAAGLGELGLSKLLLTPQFGPRQRVFALFTDAVLDPDPLLEVHICDDCGECARACPADAIPTQRNIEFEIEGRKFSHSDLDCGKCIHVHQGWDPNYSPFVDAQSSRENPPAYFRFLDGRLRHRSICGARGCIRKCMDHLERTGRIQKQYSTPMVEGEQWVLPDLPN
jgi:ferredoxin